MSTVTIIDCGVSNLGSIYRALEKCDAQPCITSDPEELCRADRIVLPGVGAFGAAMGLLSKADIDEAIGSAAASGTPVLGICLGMHLLVDESDEVSVHKGLGLIPGRAERLIPSNQNERIPHMGWNTVRSIVPNPLLSQSEQDIDFYFVHSFHVKCSDKYVVATTPFCGGFVSMIQHGNVFGTQFHPEKSLRSGIVVLKNFLAI